MFVLVRAGSLVERQHRRDLDLRRGEGLPERLDPGAVGPRVQEERQEVGARGQLDVLVPQVGDQPGKIQERNRPRRVRIQRDPQATTS
ncbi:hypothetical protein [Winogradskya consettensis]|uniref:Uncharacterized protein n=1 Tax=Winogradskya consettensis TaxID=113560 RepID=A0A919VUW1_9ACTN|nr:hypothetical protein [Actinoplanes consettensis]GIM77621.1 hypothetical protein Aco04nite_56250 [Actinoplanes consettensis]